MLLWYAAQQGPLLHRGISQISQPNVERFLRSLPPKFGVISPRTCRFLGLAVEPISLHPRQSPRLFLLQIWRSSKRTIERSIADSIDVLFHFRNCLWEAWIRSRSELAMNSVFSWNLWMQSEFVDINNADFNQELVQGFVFSWSASTVVCIGILTQLTFEGIWIGSNRSPTTVIGRKLGRSVPKSVDTGTISQEGILIEVGKNKRGLCWYCFYLQNITFLTEPYHIWLGSTLKINRRQTAVKGIVAQKLTTVLNPNVTRSCQRREQDMHRIRRCLCLEADETDVRTWSGCKIWKQEPSHYSKQGFSVHKLVLPKRSDISHIVLQGLSIEARWRTTSWAERETSGVSIWQLPLFENGVCIEAYLLSRMWDRGVYKGFVYGERKGWGCHVD